MVERAWLSEARTAGSRRLRRPRAERIGARAFVYLVALGLLLGWYGPEWLARLQRADMRSATTTSVSVPTDSLSAAFGFCHSGGGTNCVVDGDTFWFRGEKYRVADIDTPETHGPRCAAEAELGAQATRRMQALLNAGPFSLEVGERAVDRYGRSLRVVTRGGESIGAMLVAEGLARSWDGARRSWCPA